MLFSGFFWQGAALGLTAAATPGSLQTLLISETLWGGFRRGARITLAPLITDAPIIVAVFHFARNLGLHVVHGLLLSSIAVLAIFGILLLQRGLS